MIGAAILLLLTFSAAAIGGLASRNAEQFYAELAKPAWAPDASVFGPVWTVLYVLMAVAAVLVWWSQPWSHSGVAARQRGLILYVVQLALNGLWTWLFFAWRLGALALVDIVALAAVLVWTILEFRRAHRVAAWLLLPYLAWVLFATALTLTIWRGNPDLL
jgi:translocator protein